MKDIITLKFPTGEFTHSELAVANGKTNQQVWTAYQKAIKDDIIVSAGERKGAGGKPSKLWKVQDGIVVPVVTVPVPAIQSVPRVNRVVQQPAVVSMAKEADIALVVEAKLASVKPALAPEPVAVVDVVEPVKVIKNLTGAVTTTNYECPFCKTKLLAVDVESGVKVWCPVNDWKVCSCSENPYGVANNVKNAVDILHDKFFKHRPTKA